MSSEELKMRELEKKGDWLYTLVIILLALFGILYLYSNIDLNNAIKVVGSQVEKQSIDDDFQIEMKHIKTNNEDYYEYKNYAIFSGEQLKKQCDNINFLNYLINYINPPKENINYLMNLGSYSIKEVLENKENIIYKIKPSFAENVKCNSILYDKQQKELIYKNKYIRLTMKK